MVRFKKRKNMHGYAWWEQRDIILAYLQKHPEGLLLKEIAKGIGASTQTVAKRMPELIKEKKVNARKIGTCHYRLYYSMFNWRLTRKPSEQEIDKAWKEKLKEEHKKRGDFDGKAITEGQEST